MALPPTCRDVFPLLSPYVDGELSVSERQSLDRHLSACATCTGRVADLRAEAGLVRVGMEMLADEADFTGFAQKVLARIEPMKPPLWDRVRIALSETFTYQRRQLMTGFAVAALAVVAATGWMLRPTRAAGYGGAQLAVQSVSLDSGAKVSPVVMKTRAGDAIIWLVAPAESVPEAAAGAVDAQPDSGVSAPSHEARAPFHPDRHPTQGAL